VQQAALVSDKTKRVRGEYARRAIQIDDFYLYLYFYIDIVLTALTRAILSALNKINFVKFGPLCTKL